MGPGVEGVREGRKTLFGRKRVWMVEERTLPLGRSNVLQKGTHFLRSHGTLPRVPKDTCKASISKEPK